MLIQFQIVLVLVLENSSPLTVATLSAFAKQNGGQPARRLGEPVEFEAVEF
jgi:hypothetical protein